MLLNTVRSKAVQTSRLATSAARQYSTQVPLNSHDNNTNSNTASALDRAIGSATQSTLTQAGISLEDQLVYGNPIQIPPTHGITVAHLHLRSFLPAQLDFFADFARRAAAGLNMPCSGTIPLPVQTSKWTVNKSPFVYKKAQETFERKTHKRLLTIKDSDPEVVRRWVQFLNQNSLAGVGMRVTVWENEELGAGKKRFEKSRLAEARNRGVTLAPAAPEVVKGKVVEDGSSEHVKAVADQLLHEIMKDLGGAEEVASSSATSTASATSAEASQPPPAATSSETVDVAPAEKPAPQKPTNSDTVDSTDLDQPDQPTESILNDTAEPLVSGSSTLDPELSKAMEKAITEEATKPKN